MSDQVYCSLDCKIYLTISQAPLDFFLLQKNLNRSQDPFSDLAGLKWMAKSYIPPLFFSVAIHLLKFLARILIQIQA